jgi:hypothetical protein
VPLFLFFFPKEGRNALDFCHAVRVPRVSFNLLLDWGYRDSGFLHRLLPRQFLVVFFDAAVRFYVFATGFLPQGRNIEAH